MFCTTGFWVAFLIFLSLQTHLFCDLVWARQETHPKGTWVEVEGSGFFLNKKKQVQLRSYKDRRLRWGHNLSVGYSQFSPVRYDPEFSSDSFEQFYQGQEVPLLEASYTFKMNFLLGSLGLEASGGFYRIQSHSDLEEPSATELTLVPIFFGAVYSIDNLLREPILAPYVGGGGYVMLYREDLLSGAQPRIEGSTQPYFYLKAGGLVQIDWLVPSEARQAYGEAGIENTFLFAEARWTYASVADEDPDFSGVHWNAGLKIEF